MMSTVLYGVIFVLLFWPAFGEEGETCRTPNQEKAKCISLRSCPVIYLPLLDKPSQEMISFAQKSHCGFSKSNVPLVCCGTVNVKTLEKAATDYFRHRLLPTECGEQQTKDRITNGEDTLLDEFPWTALVGGEADGIVAYFCGGSLISARYVLTAAHCQRQISITTVRLGEHDKSQDKDCDSEARCALPVQDIGVENVKKHEGYNNKNKTNDIALLRLARGATFNQFVRPICLPLKNSVLNPTTLVTLAGWGETEFGDESNIKLKASVKVRPNKDCNDKLPLKIFSGQFCAGGDVDQKDSCKGDSGGPAMRPIFDQSPQRWTLEGIISYGLGCGYVGYPAVYTRVSEHMGWIINNMH